LVEMPVAFDELGNPRRWAVGTAEARDHWNPALWRSR
jgi:hypothetical protein